MPGVSSFTPSWLSRPSPGFNLFNHDAVDTLKKQTGGAEASTSGPDRTTACRGTEVFVAVGNEIRWSDLILLRDEWEDRKQSNNVDVAYRVLKVPVYGKITQLIPSPSGEYIAILTSHTVHVAILPDSSHLTLSDKSPLKLKAFHVGPSSHVLDQSPIATAVWHPLGLQGNCLVTVTLDAVTRVWELDKANRWSFNEPTLAVDMKKLANGSSSTDDFSPSKYGTSKGFSPDSFEMEVASACFGGFGAEDESGWSSMTLWIAMQEGDIYALCPLLPAKWQPSSTLVPKLSSSIMCRFTIADEENDRSKEERKIANSQYAWISEVTRQAKTSLANDSIIYQRPTHTSPIPKLQGPFTFGPDMDEMFEITDIYCIPALEEDDDFSEEDYAPNAEHAALSVGVVCVATSDNQVHVCIDAEGVEGRWLPAQRSSGTLHDDHGFPELLLVKSLSLGSNAATGWPTFSTDEQSRYSILITHGSGVARLSFHEWANKLEEELAGVYETGAEFRVELLVESARLDLEQFIEVPKALSDSDTSNRTITTCLNIQDSDLGNFFLTAAGGQPHAVTMEASSLGLLLEGDTPEDLDNDDIADIVGNESRPSYQPPQELWHESVLGATVRESMQGRNQRVLKEDVRLSPLTLKIVMDAHRVLSHETHRLGLAAADLFRRCERLQDEFKEQIRRVHQANSRVDSLLDGDNDDAEVYSQQDEPASDAGGVTEAIERRLRAAHERQEILVERCTAMKEKMGRLNKHPLTDRDHAWISEIKSMEQLVFGSQTDGKEEAEPAEEDDGEAQSAMITTPWQRLAQVERLRSELKARADEIKQDEMDVAQEDEDGETTSSVLSPERGKQQLRQIFVMLERESALVEATKGKLDRLSLMTL